MLKNLDKSGPEKGPQEGRSGHVLQLAGTILAGKQSVGFLSFQTGSTHSHAASINGNEHSDILLFGREAVSHHLPSKQTIHRSGFVLGLADGKIPMAKMMNPQ